MADIGVASGYAADAGLDLSSLQNSLAASGATVRGTAAFTAAQSGLSSAQSSVAASISSATAALANVDLASTASPQDGIAGLLAATGAAGQLSSLTSAGFYVGRAATNLANAST